MNSTDPPIYADKAKNLWVNARWVLKVTWETDARLLVGLIFCNCLNSGMPAALAWVGRGLINAIVDASKQGITHLETILPWLLVSMGLVFAGEIISLATKFIQRRLDEKLLLKIDLDKLHHAAALDVSWFEDPQFQDIAERAQQNTSDHFTGFLRKMFGLFTSILKAIGLIAVLVVVDPMIVLVMVPIVFPYLLFKLYQSRLRFTKEYNRATKRRWSRYFTSMLTNRGSVAETKILNLAPTLIDRYRSLVIEFLDEDRRIYSRGFIGNFVFAIIFAAIFYFLFGHIASGVLAGALTIGDVTMFAGAAGALRALLGSLADQISGAVEATLYIDNLAELLRIESRVKSASEKIPSANRGKIEIQNVSFRYPGSKSIVLSDISMCIEPGETIALVGRNGAGKTTLVKLLARFYDPDEGRIQLDGVDLRHFPLDYLHGRISFVFQNPNRYEATVTENIACGNWKDLKDRKEVEEIARHADIHEMIEKMPEGYDTLLGRKFGEYDLSGGQWKKIAVARAMARRNASLIILDEPTAGLDARSEYKLFSHYRELAAGRTTILISHRFSTVGLAGKIYVLDAGRIVESGTHQELMAQNGHYASLYNLHRSRMDFQADGAESV